MARELVFDYQGKRVSCNMEKVDRTKLYGTVRREVQDSNGSPCRLVTLAGDGKTLIDSGGSAFGYLDADMLWREKAELKPVDLQGNEITPVESSFKAPIALDRKVEVNELLNHNIHAVYMLGAEDGVDGDLLKELQGGAIYAFSFSYRGGLEADAGFMLAGADGTPWMLLGKPTEVQFVGLETVAETEPEEGEDTGEEEDGDLMDFGMM